jgi:hypothetical protein
MGTKKTTTQNQTTSNTLDPKFGDLVYNNAQAGTDLANNYQPYSGQLVAGFNEAQGAAQNGFASSPAPMSAAGRLGKRRARRRVSSAISR